MKTTLILIITLLSVLSTNATIRRVNNNPGIITNSTGPAFVYSNFNSAMQAASTTVVDTIYLEPSDINYGSISISKQIVLLGPGYLLDKNPNTPFDKRGAKVSSINLVGTTVSPFTNPSGSSIYGISVQFDSGLYGNINIGTSVSSAGIASDFTIIGCILNSINRLTYGGGNNQIKKCFILGNIDGLASNSIISNNIILGSVTGAANNLFKNNVIFGGITVNTAEFYNNIIFPNNFPSISFPNESKVYNNVCVGCTGTPTFNNFYTTASNTIFTSTEPRILDDLWDDRFKLASTSPAKNKGVNNIDCGVFSGIDPYILSGIPPIPMITAFSQGAPNAGNIPITISIKRN
jgi:hypothetical protein